MIGIIGFGNMGMAIARGIKGRVIVSDIDAKKMRRFRMCKRVLVARHNIDLVKQADIIILAVKPQNMSEVLKEVSHFVDDKLIISIAAGISTDFIETSLKRQPRVVRVMPNMNLTVGKGISAISKGRFVKRGDIEKTKRIFSKFGEVLEVKEDLLDAVTAVSGSGPAYYFLFTDLLERSARSCGLPKILAQKLALATFIGSALTADTKACSMNELVKQVASKRGTTEAALEIFKKCKLERIVKDAVKSAMNRARELRKIYETR